MDLLEAFTVNKALNLAAILAVLPATAATGTPPIPLAAASAVFTRAHALCSSDGERLWGVSLCGPLMLADPKTYAAITNKPAPGAQRAGTFYRFTLPANSSIGNTAVEYDGIRWTQVIWPLTGSAEHQAVVLMHESFHRIQPELGFVATDEAALISGDPALDTETGRIWLRGEIHALRVALTSSGDARKKALTDALTMRAYRHKLLPTTVAPEHELVIMEGLAESTGIDAGLPPAKRMAYTLDDLTFAENASSYARDFFYAIGPAYSELLDTAEPDWRRKVTPATSIAALAAQAYHITTTVPSAARAQAIISRYGARTIEREEKARQAEIAARNARYRSEFITGPTLSLPMTHFKMSFNSDTDQRFGNHGFVYRQITVSAPWGKIVVHDSAMISRNFSVLTVPAPSSIAGPTLHGPGWVLMMATGSKVVPDLKKPGSYMLAK